MSVNTAIADAYVDHRLDLLRFEAGTVERLTRAYEAALGGVVADLRRADRELRAGQISQATRDRLDEKRLGLRAELAALLQTQAQIIGEALEVSAQVEILAAAEAWTLATQGTGPVWTSPPVADVLAALTDPIGGRGWPDRLAVNLRGLHDTASPILARAAARGASIPRLTRDLQELSGLVSRRRSDLVSLARTEIQRVAAVAADASFAANSDVLQGVEYLATLDSRTCPVCAPDHGETYTLDEDRPIVPRHPRCRCFYAPITKSWTELGLGRAQASLFDGRPSGGPDFPTWLSRQPQETADAILGPTRAAAWRAGVPLRAFSDGRETLTVDQVKRRYPDAF